ncbi:MAG: hypothetical protein KatS3mg038_1442 [Candidatus Kapaibacterium sp.]|nr:MAG: hypothetical protein KatS3mg038_1442 [Candidatus Kapabacteria bacterium]
MYTFGAADVLWHRNYVAIARAVRMEKTHPPSRCAIARVVGLCHQYGVPVHVSKHDAITVGGAVTVRGKTRRVVLYTEHATINLPGRTVSGLLEDKSLVALVRQAIEQAVAEIRGRIEELLRTQGVCDADG